MNLIEVKCPKQLPSASVASYQMQYELTANPVTFLSAAFQKRRRPSYQGWMYARVMHALRTTLRCMNRMCMKRWL